MLALPLGAVIGQDSNEFVETFDTYLASFSTDYNPAATPHELRQKSDVVANATLIDVEDGRYFGPEEGGRKACIST